MECCNFSIEPLSRAPFPHVIKTEFLTRSFYRSLKEAYPTIPRHSGPKRSGGRSGCDLYRDDPAFERLLEAPVWNQFYRELHSQTFVDYVAAQFPEEIAHSKLNGRQLRFVDYVEHREMLSKTTGLPTEGTRPEDVFVRMDIQQAHDGYHKPVHCDHRRRVISMIFFVCDHNETEMVGGEFVLHGINRRLLKKTYPEHSRFAPADNLAIIFPRGTNSFHSVSPLQSCRAPRNFLYIAVSSRVPIW